MTAVSHIFTAVITAVITYNSAVITAFCTTRLTAVNELLLQ